MTHISVYSGLWWLAGAAVVFGVGVLVLSLARIAAEADQRQQEMFWERNERFTRDREETRWMK